MFFSSVYSLCFLPPPPSPSSLRQKVPVLQPMDLMVEATARRVFSNAHTYHINSISVNSDLQTFISTDDLRVNLWNLEITDRSFSILSLLGPVGTRQLLSELKSRRVFWGGFFESSSSHVPMLQLFLSACFLDIVDIKPANMEELTEVITSAEFHPQQCHTFAYSSSKGSIRLCDMRQAALCDKHCKCESP